MKAIDSGTKTIITIFIKTLSIYAILSVFFYCYEGLIDHHGNYYSSFLDQYSLIKLILNLLKYPIVWILHTLGYTVIVTGPMISLVHGKGIVIYTACLGIQIMIGYVALIIGFPGRKKLLFILSGLIFIHLLNILRMVSIILTVENYPSVVDLSHDIFTYMSYVIMILFYYLWTKKYAVDSNHAH